MPVRADDRRRRLLAVLAETNPELLDRSADTMSLIRSGLIDSLGLLNIALFVEAEIGGPVDDTALDPGHEWDTVVDILRFIDARTES